MKQSSKEKDRFPQFRERFRELQGDMSNTEFAEFLGMSRQTVGFYCNGDRIPDALAVADIAQKCNVSTDWLLGLSEFRSKEDYHNANEFCNNLLMLLSKDFVSEDMNQIENLLVGILNGFRYVACRHGDAYCYYSDVIYALSRVLEATASAIPVALASTAENSIASKEELFSKIDRIFEESSVYAYNEIGMYIADMRKTIIDMLGIEGYRFGWARFSFDAEKMLKSGGDIVQCIIREKGTHIERVEHNK